MEDVWISRQEEEMPQWLADSNVRDGIRTMLKKDGCLWERRRLGREADNLCRWLGAELSAVELAIRMKNRKLFFYYMIYLHAQIYPARLLIACPSY